MATEEELSDKLDRVISEVLAECGGEFRFGVPVHWVLVVGHQEPTGEESAVSYIPKHGQPFYVSMGLVNYQAARLEGIVQDRASE